MQTLFEDAALLAIDKPPGIAVVPGRGETPADALRGRLEAARGAPIWVVHRLDRGTSGVVVFAKTAASHRALCIAFEERRVRKRYRALVSGGPSADAGTCDLPLRPGRKGSMRVASVGEPGSVAARTAYVVAERFEGGALIDLAPETGRQHQLRVHLSALGAPIFGDPLYAPAEIRKAVGRLMLHASELVLPPEFGRDSLTLAAPEPADFLDLLARLRGRRTP